VAPDPLSGDPLLGAELGGIGGDGVDVDAAKPADLDGFEIAGANERPCGRPADAESCSAASSTVSSRRG
jgi:hypothetical protein